MRVRLQGEVKSNPMYLISLVKLSLKNYTICAINWKEFSYTLTLSEIA